jgi:hypothetical protein
LMRRRSAGRRERQQISSKSWTFPPPRTVWPRITEHSCNKNVKLWEFRVFLMEFDVSMLKRVLVCLVRCFTETSWCGLPASPILCHTISDEMFILLIKTTDSQFVPDWIITNDFKQSTRHEASHFTFFFSLLLRPASTFFSVTSLRVRQSFYTFDMTAGGSTLNQFTIEISLKEVFLQLGMHLRCHIFTFTCVWKVPVSHSPRT